MCNSSSPETILKLIFSILRRSFESGRINTGNKPVLCSNHGVYSDSFDNQRRQADQSGKIQKHGDVAHSPSVNKWNWRVRK